MSQIPVIQSVVNQMLTDYIVDGKVLPNGQVSYKGGIVSATFMNGIVPEANKTVLMTKVNNLWYVIASESLTSMPYQFFLGSDFHVVSGPPFVSVLLSTAWFTLHNYQFPPALNNSAKITAFLEKGSYLFRTYNGASGDRAIVSWYFDNLLIGTHDTYSSPASPVYLDILIYVPNTGLHQMKYVVTGKNPSSTNYYYVLSGVSFRRLN